MMIRLTEVKHVAKLPVATIVAQMNGKPAVKLPGGSWEVAGSVGPIPDYALVMPVTVLERPEPKHAADLPAVEALAVGESVWDREGDRWQRHGSGMWDCMAGALTLTTADLMKEFGPIWVKETP